MPETIYSIRRKKLKLTNGQIAKALDVSESYISKIMHGARQAFEIEEPLRELLKLKTGSNRKNGKKAS